MSRLDAIWARFGSLSRRWDDFWQVGARDNPEVAPKAGRLDAEWSQRTGAWDDFWQATVYDYSGTGTNASTATLALTGNKGAEGAGSWAGGATLSLSGQKGATAVGGVLTATLAFTQSGRKESGGIGALAATATLAATGSSSAPVTPAFDFGYHVRYAIRPRPLFVEEHAGAGAMRIAISMQAIGTHWEPIELAGTGELRAHTSMRAGGRKTASAPGSVALRPRMQAIGWKTFESDDELVLALAA